MLLYLFHKIAQYFPNIWTFCLPIISYFILGISAFIIIGLEFNLRSKVIISKPLNKKQYAALLILCILLWPKLLPFIKENMSLDIYNIGRLIQGKGIWNIMKTRPILSEYFLYNNDESLIYHSYSDVNGIEFTEELVNSDLKDVSFRGMKSIYKQLIPKNMKIDQNTILFLQYIESEGIPVFEFLEAGDDKEIALSDEISLQVTFDRNVNFLKLNNFIFGFDKEKDFKDYTSINDGLIYEYSINRNNELIIKDKVKNSITIANSKKELSNSKFSTIDQGIYSNDIIDFVKTEKGTFKYIYNNDYLDKIICSYDYNCYIKTEELLNMSHTICILNLLPYVRINNDYIVTNDNQKIYQVTNIVLSDDEKILSKNIDYYVISLEDENRLIQANEMTYNWAECFDSI